MKKRTACFGWTKKLQRRVAHANQLSGIAGKLESRAALVEADPKRRKTQDPLKLRDVAANLHKTARETVAKVKADHRAHVDALRDGV